MTLIECQQAGWSLRALECKISLLGAFGPNSSKQIKLWEMFLWVKKNIQRSAVNTKWKVLNESRKVYSWKNYLEGKILIAQATRLAEIFIKGIIIKDINNFTLVVGSFFEEDYGKSWRVHQGLRVQDSNWFMQFSQWKSNKSVLCKWQVLVHPDEINFRLAGHAFDPHQDLNSYQDCSFSQCTKKNHSRKKMTLEKLWWNFVLNV